VARLIRPKLRWLLHSAFLSLATGMLPSCATSASHSPGQSAAIRTFPPSPSETVVEPRVNPRPARKPTPPSPVGSPVPTTGEQTVGITVPKPSGAVPNIEAPAPTPASPTSASPASSEIQLIGLDQPAATRLFGPAAERLEVPPATVWRYRGVGCELDLFFYLDLRSGRMRTLHYALKGDASGAARQQDCLRSLLASR
jgi:hypothetical protein